MVDYIPEEGTARGPEPVEPGPDFGGLTGVEKRVLGHLCEGMSNVEIAQAMGYSEATVKKHVSQLITRFEVTSRLRLAVSAIRSGFGW